MQAELETSKMHLKLIGIQTQHKWPNYASKFSIYRENLVAAKSY